MDNTAFTPLDAWTSQLLLDLPLGEPERLFTRDETRLAQEYHYLARRFHPDLSPDSKAKEAFAHLGLLYDAAKKKLADGTWQTPGLSVFNGRDGKKRQLRFAKKVSFELGSLYIARSVVAYEITPDHADLARAAQRHLTTLRFADTAMKEACSRFLPTVKDFFETDTAHILVVDKEPESIRLRDVLSLWGGKMDGRHAAWILSGLHHLACYLDWAGLSHGAIGPDDYFISPLAHTGALLGGWWYAAQAGAPLTALPARSVDLAPPDILRTGQADKRLDLALIRATGRELLGDLSGRTLSADPYVPTALSSWLSMPTSGDARTDYQTWFGEILPASYGPRRYTKMDLTFDATYGTGPIAKGGVAPP